MRILETILLILIFSLGMVTHGIITQLFYVDVQQPFPVSFKGFNSPERLSPGDHVVEDQIGVYNDKVVLDIDKPRWASFTDTNSMDPLIDASSHGIEIVPKSVDDISIGDIISYESSYTDGFVIHRVIEKGIDEEGAYFILKGDNNSDEDPEKVRFDKIHGVLVAIIY